MLDLIWVGIFNDGKVIRQFDDTEQKVENKFSEIQNRQDSLIQFALVNEKTGVAYLADLVTGTISIQLINDSPLFADDDMRKENTKNYRLIYFRRVQHHFTSDLQTKLSSNINYFLGFQYNDQDGRNHKTLMKISPDGRVTLS